MFRTSLKIDKSTLSISHRDSIMSIGSCFSENIGERLEQYKFPISINPFGILFNPISIVEALKLIHDDYQFTENDIFNHHGKWHSFLHHGKFSNTDKTACLNSINTAIKTANERLKTVDYLIITFGTANVFEYKKTKQTVANCHKLPNQDFDRNRLSVEAITKPFLILLKRLKKENPRLNVIFTVSPVRHIRDGLVENQRSKSTLLLAIDELTKGFDFTTYFPSYELVIDDLRDYRFYKEDMIHPSKVAIDYIWKTFSTSYFEEGTKQVNQQIHKLIQAKNHRVENVNSVKYQLFIKNQVKKIEQLQKQYKWMNFEQDLNEMSSRISNDLLYHE
jgi:hypothetical protein